MVKDNRKQREKRKTYAEALKEDFRNRMKKSREGRVNSGIRDNVSYVNKAMNCSEEGSSEFGKPKPNFSEIYKDLLISEQINSSGMFSTPPVLNTDTSTSHNAGNSSIRSICASADLSLNTHDEEILNILEELQCSVDQRIVEKRTEQCRLSGNFVSDTVFNLINNVLSDTEIRVLEKGLDFASIQNKVSEHKLRRDFKKFCRRMRLKWHFSNQWHFRSNMNFFRFLINVYFIPIFLRKNGKLLDHWQKIDLLLLKRQTKVRV